jgi:hypothetical protein
VKLLHRFCVALLLAEFRCNQLQPIAATDVDSGVSAKSVGRS